jgi:hypothetical protein
VTPILPMWLIELDRRAGVLAMSRDSGVHLTLDLYYAIRVQVLNLLDAASQELRREREQIDFERAHHHEELKKAVAAERAACAEIAKEKAAYCAQFTESCCSQHAAEAAAEIASDIEAMGEQS